jgi:hypothetical protein
MRSSTGNSVPADSVADGNISVRDDSSTNDEKTEDNGDNKKNSGASAERKSSTFLKYGSGAEMMHNVLTGSTRILNSTRVMDSVGPSSVANSIVDIADEPREVKELRIREEAHLPRENRHHECCTSSKVFHIIANPAFVVFSAGATAAAGYFSITKMLNQGVLSPYSRRGINGASGADRSNAELMNSAFPQSTIEEQRAFVEAIWYSSMFAVGFAFVVFSIIRTSRALPKWTKILYYSTCIPLVVLAQWTSNTSEFFMYLDYNFNGAVVAEWSSQVFHIAQLATRAAAGLCGVAIFSAAFSQMRAGSGRS